jgi:hypothetical protein
MPGPTTVWEVDLVRGRVAERRGSLSLETDALVFRPDDARAGDRRIALPAITRVKRLLASPVLLVRHVAGAASLETAFYFVEPPRLRADDTEVRRFTTGKRRTRREGAATLVGANRGLRADLKEWERGLRDAVAGRRHTP